ncbi:hypothetical protein NE237_010459 [Protea cynaroides]|uniref:Uncharacterized protein n=1 Tax=Protea cynaroides TaxID=273540 RepID=A0A9Q0R1L1_9MAGN|nr:hypothetical protein NE237_010459 [Protea cynaroides]
MAKECLNGVLDNTSYGAPAPFIGLYIAFATLVCFFSITFDLVYGIKRKKPFVPCKLFRLNAFTLTMLAVATKIPNDLTTAMPRSEDQLSKLTATVLMCTSLGYYMPSLGTMDTSELYGNLAALSVMVITIVVNVCIQMRTGVIFAFKIQHIIIVVCILVLLLLMWSSAIFVRYLSGKKRILVNYDTSGIESKGLDRIKQLLMSVHAYNYFWDPHTLLCSISYHHIFGLVSSLSSAVVIQAMLSSFVLKSRRFCNGESDYKWSILIVILAQFLTIAIGTFSIICRWFSFISHSSLEDVYPDQFLQNQVLELEDLKLKILSFKLDFIVDVLIGIQNLLNACSGFIRFPIYIVKKFLGYIIPFDCISRDNSEELEFLKGNTNFESLLSSMQSNGNFFVWRYKMAIKEMMRWRIMYESENMQLNHLMQLISKCPKSECNLIKKLQAIGEHFSKEIQGGKKFEYRVSCVSVLIELMSYSPRESLMHNLDDSSFEIIYFVDQKTNAPNILNETRWTTTKDLWVHWANSNHWFRTVIIRGFKGHGPLKTSLQTSNELDLELRIRGKTCNKGNFVNWIIYGDTLADKHMALVAVEFLIICTFIKEQKDESGKDLFDCLKECFAEMVCFALRGLPIAILNEIGGGDDLSDMEERRVREALKFLSKLESLGDTIEWSWPANMDPKTKAKDVHSHAISSEDLGSEVKANVSNDIDGKVGNTDSVSAVATVSTTDYGDDDESIIEIESNEIV